MPSRRGGCATLRRFGSGWHDHSGEFVGGTSLSLRRAWEVLWLDWRALIAEKSNQQARTVLAMVWLRHDLFEDGLQADVIVWKCECRELVLQTLGAHLFVGGHSRFGSDSRRWF
jgi:hypothetical protein